MNNVLTEPLIATYLHEKGRRLGLPVSGTFELTARCNFNCPMCYVHLTNDEVNKRGNELSAQQWIDIAQNACDNGMMFALITGGEPLVRKDFFDIYNAMKEMGLLISINTNGYLLEGEILNKLIDNPPFRINISVYGTNNITYKNMCGIEAFDRVSSNILALKNAGIDVRLNLSLTPYNRNDLDSFYNLSRELDVPIKFNTYMYPPLRINGGIVTEGSRLTPYEAVAAQYEWDKLRLTDEEFSKRTQNILNLSAFEDSECSVDSDEGVRCRAGRSSFWVTWDGKLLPCGMLTKPVISLLDNDFMQAWDYIRNESNSISLPDKCIHCPKKKICSICPAVCATETGDFSGVPEYMCEYSDALISSAKMFHSGEVMI